MLSAELAKKSKVLEDFAKPFVKRIAKKLKEQLCAESPLRTKFQVNLVPQGELPFYDNNSKTFYYEGRVSKTSARRLLIPLFEIECHPLISYSILEKLSPKKIIESFLKISTEILEKEKGIYNKIMEAAENKKGKGKFVIKVDLTVIPSVQPEKNLVGFFIFEHVGVAYTL